MKKIKIIIILCITILIFSVVAIVTLSSINNKKNEPKIVELTSENFEDYIIFNVSIEDFTVEKGRGLYSWYTGVAELNASARLKKDVQVNNIVIKGRVETSGLCWALKSYNFILELDKDGKAEYSKQITTGEASMLYPDEPKISTLSESMENEFIVKDTYIQVSGSIIE